MVDNGKINFIKKDRHPRFLSTLQATQRGIFLKIIQEKKSKLTGEAKKKIILKVTIKNTFN